MTSAVLARTSVAICQRARPAASSRRPQTAAVLLAGAATADAFRQRSAPATAGQPARLAKHSAASAMTARCASVTASHIGDAAAAGAETSRCRQGIHAGSYLIQRHQMHRTPRLLLEQCRQMARHRRDRVPGEARLRHRRGRRRATALQQGAARPETPDRRAPGPGRRHRALRQVRRRWDRATSSQSSCRAPARISTKAWAAARSVRWHRPAPAAVRIDHDDLHAAQHPRMVPPKPTRRRPACANYHASVIGAGQVVGKDYVGGEVAPSRPLRTSAVKPVQRRRAIM